MIPLELRNVLVDEAKKLFGGFWLKNCKDELVELNVYSQRLPAKKTQDDEEHFPYIVVRLQDGEEIDESDPHTCRVLFVVGIYDDKDDYQGDDDVLNILARLQQHLFVSRVFAGRYRIEYPVRWSVTEEDVYPFFFGGLETNWVVGKTTQKEDEYT